MTTTPIYLVMRLRGGPQAAFTTNQAAEAYITSLIGTSMPRGGLWTKDNLNIFILPLQSEKGLSYEASDDYRSVLEPELPFPSDSEPTVSHNWADTKRIN